MPTAAPSLPPRSSSFHPSSSICGRACCAATATPVQPAPQDLRRAAAPGGASRRAGDEAGAARRRLGRASRSREDVVRLSVGELRAALGDERAAPRFIETVPRRGYRFIAAWAPRRPADRSRQTPRCGGSPEADGAVVGRVRERGRIAEWLRAARSGRRQVAFVSGEAGIGKTTLVDAALRELRRASGDRVPHRARPVRRALRRRRALPAGARRPGRALSRRRRPRRSGRRSASTRPTGSCARSGPAASGARRGDRDGREHARAHAAQARGQPRRARRRDPARPRPRGRPVERLRDARSPLRPRPAPRAGAPAGPVHAAAGRCDRARASRSQASSASSSARASAARSCSMGSRAPTSRATSPRGSRARSSPRSSCRSSSIGPTATRSSS